ncbi:Gag-Pol polyprotein [Habropoda laboriosa]|uniref:RNA-directed DNA polymerase n=1 Tax=Habropoda laboriosa TaxID=597456 RepID=A0A0L7QJQ1_9HYME|nr:Gag-Pol polyprotein [Habropoda laboriosa]
MKQLLDFEDLAKSQSEDEELKTYVRDNTGSALRLEKVTLPETRTTIYCDTSTNATRPFITKPLRRAAFDTIHRFSHPRINATVKLVTERYVWLSIKADCRKWAHGCVECQRSKVTRHVQAPIGKFTSPSGRFEHIHIDIVVLPVSEGFRYCLTCIDHFTRWPEAIPLKGQEAATVARTFYEGWIVRFGTPLRVTTDRGRQFESHLFKHLNQLTGTTHLQTTAYHPAANGMVERFHWQLKGAICCHQNARWTEVLPTIMLGIRAAWREDLKSTATELVYGRNATPTWRISIAPTERG